MPVDEQIPLQLNERFFALWKRIGARGDPTHPFAILVARYAEPWRKYHTLMHLHELYEELDAFRGSWEANAVHFETVETALWYHDAVYSTQAKDNEERSTDLLWKDSRELCFGRVVTEWAAKAILATKHAALPKDPNCAVMCDIDLAILGKSEPKFDRYERSIRQEYAWAPEADFREGRAAILRSFLARPSLYATEFFHERYEAKARENLARSLSRLVPEER